MERLALHVLQSNFHAQSFRPGQQEAVLRVLSGGRSSSSLMCTMATGSGKVCGLCYGPTCSLQT